MAVKVQLPVVLLWTQRRRTAETSPRLSAPPRPPVTTRSTTRDGSRPCTPCVRKTEKVPSTPNSKTLAERHGPADTSDTKRRMADPTLVLPPTHDPPASRVGPRTPPLVYRSDSTAPAPATGAPPTECLVPPEGLVGHPGTLDFVSDGQQLRHTVCGRRVRRRSDTQDQGLRRHPTPVWEEGLDSTTTHSLTPTRRVRLRRRKEYPTPGCPVRVPAQGQEGPRSSRGP